MSVPSSRSGHEDPLSPGCPAPLSPGLGDLYSPIAGGGARGEWLCWGRSPKTCQWDAAGACPWVRKPPSLASLRSSIPAPLIWHQFPVIPGRHTEGLHPASPALAAPFVILLLRSLDRGAELGLGPLNKRHLISRIKVP